MASPGVPARRPRASAPFPQRSTIHPHSSFCLASFSLSRSARAPSYSTIARTCCACERMYSSHRTFFFVSPHTLTLHLTRLVCCPLKYYTCNRETALLPSTRNACIPEIAIWGSVGMHHEVQVVTVLQRDMASRGTIVSGRSPPALASHHHPRSPALATPPRRACVRPFSRQLFQHPCRARGARGHDGCAARHGDAPPRIYSSPQKK